MKLFKSSLLLATTLIAWGCSPANAPDTLSDNTTTNLSVNSATETLAENPAIPFDYKGEISSELATQFSTLALDCVQREFPNKISRTTDTAEEIGRPQDIFPVFYGCFDWHSAVHGHWLLIRLIRMAPDGAWKDEARAKLEENFSVENIDGEIANFARPARGAWERPYGLAWFLQLTAELREWDDPQGKVWLERLEPLEADIAQSLNEWLPKLAYPVRLGTHNQSAFAFGLMWDWAETAKDDDMLALLKERSLAFHQSDVNCPLAYEPSGEDFLSPCLMEADLMRRVLSQDAFSKWLSDFMPSIPVDGSDDWLAPGIVKDASDGKLVHLDGVNLSRAWNLYNLASVLPETDPRRASLIASAQLHERVGIAAISDEHYSGSHWLASFATYLVTARGIN
ncbi:DUF2891 family protein [Litorimonas taeanensis]|uniref:DUF2891 family protein n=1 Tax=Litorimonas taeanensis TaxID=568099 RepID=A0A420WD15_9PROT|nr:DUF2891 domain-containing protein [Litorimonas taeanensis]RKQ68873.1 DUF2891 family protein [Litorimonas taeanensis]